MAYAEVVASITRIISINGETRVARKLVKT